MGIGLASRKMSRLLWRKSRIHCGSPFISRDLFDDLVRQALARLEDVVFGLAKTPLVFLVRRLHLVGLCGHVRASQLAVSDVA